MGLSLQPKDLDEVRFQLWSHFTFSLMFCPFSSLLQNFFAFFIYVFSILGCFVHFKAFFGHFGQLICIFGLYSFKLLCFICYFNVCEFIKEWSFNVTELTMSFKLTSNWVFCRWNKVREFFVGKVSQAHILSIYFKS